MSTTIARTFLPALTRTNRSSLPSISNSLIRSQPKPKAVQRFSSSSSSNKNDDRSYSQEAHSSSNRKSHRQRSLVGGVVALSVVGISYYFLSSNSSSSSSSSQVLSPDRWTRVEIESVEQLTRDTSLFKLKVPRTVLPQSFQSLISKDGGGQVQPILSLYVKEPTLQIQRAYTPLSAKSFNPDGSATLELVVKRYPDGEVSRYLHRLGTGDSIEIRAPSITWVYNPRDWDRVVFIAGGTGVTPAFQCLNDTIINNNKKDLPELSLIYASPSPSQIFLKPQLDSLLKQGNGIISKILYKVDRLDNNNTHDNVDELPKSDLEFGKIDLRTLEKFLARNDENKRTVIVVCGPEGMIETVAGSRGRNFSQGPVGGILKQLGYTKDQVVKL
ncbi:hypothetical protein JCM5350_002429 [Sporobolomyces pararoseus]